MRRRDVGRSSLLFVAVSWAFAGIWAWSNEPAALPEASWRVQDLMTFLERIPPESRGGKRLPPYQERRTTWVAEVSKSEQGSKRPLTIELNQADSVQLEALPFIGPVLAGRVVRFRQALGGFHSVEQLKEVYGMDSLAYAVVSKRVEVDAAQIQTMCLDTASWSTMRSHPYIGTQGARAVERYRMAHGMKRIEDLAGHPPIGDSLFARWRPYVRCCQCTE